MEVTIAVTKMEQVKPIDTDDRTQGEVCRDLNTVLAGMGLTPDDYGFSAYAGDQLWPSSYRWLACHAVTGDSEGYYVHIAIVGASSTTDAREYINLATAKCWSWDLAASIATACGVLLRA